MHKSEYSSIDSTNGNVSWKGPLSVEKGDHSGMPSRTDAYLPGDEKGHVNASSLAGDNSEANVVAQNKDLNHGGYLSIESYPPWFKSLPYRMVLIFIQKKQRLLTASLETDRQRL